MASKLKLVSGNEDVAVPSHPTVPLPPGWVKDANEGKALPPNIELFDDEYKGKCIRAKKAFKVGDPILSEDASLVIVDEPHYYVGTSAQPFIQKIAKQYGRHGFHHGVTQLVASYQFLEKQHAAGGLAPSTFREQQLKEVFDYFNDISTLENEEGQRQLRRVCEAIHHYMPNEATKGSKSSSTEKPEPEAKSRLQTPDDVYDLAGATSLNCIRVETPGMPKRRALFPTIRFIEHECRPNCIFFAVDGDEEAEEDDEILALRERAKYDRFDPDELAKAEKAIRKMRKKTTDPVKRLMKMLTVRGQVNAIRDIAPGEPITITYISQYKVTEQRRKLLQESYGFLCKCRWCETEPDLPRAFRCKQCEEGFGVISPTGDGSKEGEWRCLQCGFLPSHDEIERFRYEEKKMRTVKADKTVGMHKLISDPYLHYSHEIVFAKLDQWSEHAWEEQDALLTMNYVECLMKCVNRVFQQDDPTKAQYHEFLGQVNHAVGNAHTAKHEYQTAQRIRRQSGLQNTRWYRKTQYMAEEKSLADFMDSK